MLSALTLTCGLHIRLLDGVQQLVGHCTSYCAYRRERGHHRSWSGSIRNVVRLAGRITENKQFPDQSQFRAITW
jgi:hypothetical protein